MRINRAKNSIFMFGACLKVLKNLLFQQKPIKCPRPARLCSRMFLLLCVCCSLGTEDLPPLHRPILLPRTTSDRAAEFLKRKLARQHLRKLMENFFFLPTGKQLLIDHHSRPRTPSHPLPAKLLLISLHDKRVSSLCLGSWGLEEKEGGKCTCWGRGSSWDGSGGPCAGGTGVSRSQERAPRDTNLSASRPPGGHSLGLQQGLAG